MMRLAVGCSGPRAHQGLALHSTRRAGSDRLTNGVGVDWPFIDGIGGEPDVDLGARINDAGSVAEPSGPWAGLRRSFAVVRQP